MAMKMGWMLTGDAFPKKWRKAWDRAFKTLAGRLEVSVIPGGLPDDVLLDVFRAATTIASNECSIPKEVTEFALPEVLEPSTRTMEELREALAA